MATWPVSLPQAFLAGTAQSSIADGRIVTPVETGLPRMRRRNPVAERPLSGAMYVTATQLADLETFFETTTNGGVDVFTFPNPFAAGNLEVRFGDAPSYQREAAADLVRVSLAFRVVP